MKADRTIRLVSDALKEQWDSVIAHPLQSWAWGEFRKGSGIDVVRIGVFDADKLANGWQLTFHKVPYTPWTVGYFPKGPLPDAFMIRELQKLSVQKNALYIQIEPDSTQKASVLGDLSTLTPSHRPLFTPYTFILDITKSEEEMLASMHPKTRYNIRVAQKRGVTVKEDNSPEALQAYLSLSEKTTKRQGFYAHNRQYHTAMWNIMHAAGVARLFTARFEGTIIAAWVIFIWNRTIYYPYGASSRQHKDVMAPNLLLWEVVRWAKQKNYDLFDLWGSLGPNPDVNDPWYGFHRFKEGYKPRLVEFIGSYDLIAKPVLYRLFILADRIRWALLHLRHR